MEDSIRYVQRSVDTSHSRAAIRWVNGQMVGTTRLHDSTLQLDSPEGPTIHAPWLTRFDSQAGKALLLRSPWELFSDFYARVTPDPKKGEFWLTIGRINEIWQSGFDDRRKPYLRNRWPDTWVEVHPDDAARYGIESGDVVQMYSNDILIQTGGWVRVTGYTFTDLVKEGLIRTGKGDVRAVAIVSADVRPGVPYTNFLYPSSPANSLVHRVPDPIANVYRFKLGKAQIRKVGESPYKKALEEMTFKPRTVE